MKELCFILGVLVGVFLGYIKGSADRYAAFQEEAVEKNHAEWFLDAKHERQWRWKEGK